MVQHFIEYYPDTLHSTSPTKSLEHRAKYNRINLLFALIIVQELAQKLVGAINVSIGNNCLNHATNGDACWPYTLRAHCFPALPSTIHVVCVAICLDQSAKCVRTGDLDAIFSLQLFQLLCEQSRFADAHASFDYRGKQDFIHGLLHAINKLHCAHDVCLGRSCFQTSEENGAGDLVRVNPIALHLIDSVPNQGAVGSLITAN
mmetsp:Transcript_39095/g.72566  ORF Transcript_39095/g.72566 Transcript_39095/m.72566 type:complete len:203 (+) Transcript_39095:1097-1705(+)